MSKKYHIKHPPDYGEADEKAPHLLQRPSSMGRTFSEPTIGDGVDKLTILTQKKKSSVNFQNKRKTTLIRASKTKRSNSAKRGKSVSKRRMTTKPKRKSRKSSRRPTSKAH